MTQMDGFQILDEDGSYARPDYYPPGYREDEDTYVYDQCCDNCRLRYGGCPMDLPDMELEPGEYRRVMKRRREDAALRDGHPVWCIYWQANRRRG